MKQNNKKVPDAPERYFVGPFPKPISDITKSCSFAAMNQWAGIKEKILEEDHEYINLSHVWHKITDMPDCMDEYIVVADKDYKNPKIINLGCAVRVLKKRGSKMDLHQIWEFIGTEIYFAHWAYFSCFIPYHF